MGYSRRTFLSLAGGAVASPLALGQSSSGAETVVATTASGKVRGARRDGVTVFKGIPYAGSPAGKNRFKAPPKLKPWTGVRDALHYGPQAIQPPDSGWPKEWKPAPSSEDCLVLNVWTQGVHDGRKRPIMFYSHGGGFVTGNGGADVFPQDRFHDGTALAKNYDVIVVTHNHRLGLLGYLYLGDILGEEYAASGCAGMLDIAAALAWIRENAEAFGGDPENIMIWGESGGGAKTTTLLVMPAAHGHFEKASIESGAVLRLRDQHSATETTREVLAKLGLSVKQARELLAIPAHRLRDVQVGRGGGMGAFSPVVDGHYIPANPFDPVAPAISANIPIIVGTNKDETIMFFQRGDLGVFSLDEAGLRKRLQNSFGDKAARILEVYHRSRPKASPADLYIAITTANWMWMNAIRLAERKVQQHGAPVYMYMFAYESEVPVAPGVNYPMKAEHATEMPYKFDHPDYGAPVGTHPRSPSDPVTTSGRRPERFQMARNMSGAWAAFARTSNPSHDGIPKWPAYTLEKRATMILDVPCRLVDDPFREERLLWESLT